VVAQNPNRMIPQAHHVPVSILYAGRLTDTLVTASVVQVQNHFGAAILGRITNFRDGSGQTLVIEPYGSPDNGETVPYAPLEILDTAGSGQTQLTVQPSGRVEFLIPPTPQLSASGRIELHSQPADGDTLAIEDTGGTTTTFEFDNDSSVTGGNTSVTIGSDLEETRDNLIAAINGDAFDVEAIPHEIEAQTVSLYQTVVGAAGNNSITATLSDDSVLTATGLSGGSDGTVVEWLAFRVRGSDVDDASGQLSLVAWNADFTPVVRTAEQDVGID